MRWLHVPDNVLRRTVKNEGNSGERTFQEAVGSDTDLHWEGIHGSPIEFGYRNKMEFSFGDEYKDGPLLLVCTRKAALTTY